MVINVNQSIVITATDGEDLAIPMRQCLRQLGVELPQPLGFVVGSVELKAAKPDQWLLRDNQTVVKLDTPATP